MPKRKPAKHEQCLRGAAAEEKEQRMRNYTRAAEAYEDEVLRRALRPVGRHDLFDEIGAPATADAFNAHPLMQGCYPLVLEVRFSGKSNPPPVPSAKPLPALRQMVFEFPGTLLHQWCVEPKVYDPPEEWAQGLAVVFPYNGEASLILHDRPDLTEGPPLVSRRLSNGCLLQIHWFEPFIDDVAEGCRYCFAEDGSELMERIESSADFRQTSWRDWEDREPPRGW